MNKKVRIILIEDAKLFFNQLEINVSQETKNTLEVQLYNAIKTKVEFLKLNPFYGNNIKKFLIPKNLNVDNLWRIELSHFHRMLYTIKGNEDEIVCFIIKILNHQDYNKFFGYK
jgi:hypothetical protein